MGIPHEWSFASTSSGVVHNEVRRSVQVAHQLLTEDFDTVIRFLSCRLCKESLIYILVYIPSKCFLATVQLVYLDSEVDVTY